MGLYRIFKCSYLRKAVKQQPHNLLKLQRLQDALLKTICANAFQHIPFYQAIMRERGLTPLDVRMVADLKKLPVISKRQVHEAYLTGKIINKAYLKNAIEYTTSGSSGFPLTVLYDVKSYAHAARTYVHILSEQGVRVTDRFAYFWYEPLWKQGFWESTGLFKKQEILYTEDEESQLRKLVKLNPTVIHSFPSILISLSAFMNRTHIRLRPRLIITHGEVLTEAARKRIEERFQATVLDQYRSHEFSQMAWQCPEHRNYHINADSIIMEILDDQGKEVAAGEEGRIVVTGLINKVMPLLRYDIGDRGTKSNEMCPCGRSLPVLRSIEGRSDDFILTQDGVILSPRRIGGVLEQFRTIKEYRFIQEDINVFVLKIVPLSLYPVQEETRLRDTLKRILGESSSVQFEYVPMIVQDRPGKIKAIESRVSKRYDGEF